MGMTDHAAGLRLENVADGILREHIELMERAGVLRRQRTAADAAPYFAKLVEDLPTHFAEEECDDGIFRWIVRVFPALRPRVEALQGEHAGLHEHALSALAAIQSDSDNWSQRLGAFLDDLIDHERTERVLLNEAITGAVSLRSVAK